MTLFPLPPPSTASCPLWSLRSFQTVTTTCSAASMWLRRWVMDAVTDGWIDWNWPLKWQQIFSSLFTSVRSVSMQLRLNAEKCHQHPEFGIFSAKETCFWVLASSLVTCVVHSFDLCLCCSGSCLIMSYLALLLPWVSTKAGSTLPAPQSCFRIFPYEKEQNMREALDIYCCH